MRKRGLIIFDLDGTLYKTDTVIALAIQESLSEFGLPTISPEVINKYIGKPVDQFSKWIQSLCPSSLKFEFENMVYKKEHKLIPEKGTLYPNTHGVLTKIKKYCKIVLCTNGTKQYVEHVINAFSIKKYFDLIRFRTCSSDSKEKMVEEILSFFKERPVFMVGDREEDIMSARKNNVFPIGAEYGYGDLEEMQAANIVLQSLAELPSFITNYMAAVNLKENQ